MTYLNMGHDDIDYEHQFDTTNQDAVVHTEQPIEDQLIIDGLLFGKQGEARAEVPTVRVQQEQHRSFQLLIV